MNEAPMSDTERLREAANIIAEFFSMTLLSRAAQGGKPMAVYDHEVRALDWLRVQVEADEATIICHWTGSYMRHGPPPWRKR